VVVFCVSVFVTSWCDVGHNGGSVCELILNVFCFLIDSHQMEHVVLKARWQQNDTDTHH